MSKLLKKISEASFGRRMIRFHSLPSGMCYASFLNEEDNPDDVQLGVFKIDAEMVEIVSQNTALTERVRALEGDNLRLHQLIARMEIEHAAAFSENIELKERVSTRAALGTAAQGERK